MASPALTRNPEAPPIGYAFWTPERLLAAAQKIGPSTVALCEVIMRAKPHPEQGFRSCLGILSLARSVHGQARPRVCYLPTAGGDSERNIARFYSAFARRSEASHVSLFDRTVLDLEGFLLGQDAIYVGGGNTANMLAIWRVHGLDRILRRAWDDGIVLAGRSAGSICWFEGGTTDSLGGLDPLRDGLGFLPGSHSPPYGGEAERRALGPDRAHRDPRRQIGARQLAELHPEPRPALAPGGGPRGREAMEYVGRHVRAAVGD